MTLDLIDYLLLLFLSISVSRRLLLFLSTSRSRTVIESEVNFVEIEDLEAQELVWDNTRGEEMSGGRERRESEREGLETHFLRTPRSRDF